MDATEVSVGDRRADGMVYALLEAAEARLADAAVPDARLGLKAAGLLVRCLEFDEPAVHEDRSGSPLELVTAAVDRCVGWDFDALPAGAFQFFLELTDLADELRVS
ncbi:MAG: hypothetical protein Q4G35_02355 [Propionibacteriaceae bacterium]|nr:hypothetical protein [Propionibacteriaceae bacterium]